MDAALSKKISCNLRLYLRLDHCQESRCIIAYSYHVIAFGIYLLNCCLLLMKYMVRSSSYDT
jgi:hypothetical protein